MLVLRRVTSRAFKYNLANSCARLSALPFGTTSATTPHCRAIADVCNILDNLNASIMNLAPNIGIGHVAERRKIDTGNELPSRSRQDHNLLRAILRDPVESIDELGVILRCENERPTVGSYLEAFASSGFPL
jgi:hypothetical protein